MNDLPLRILRRMAELSGGSESLATRLRVDHSTLLLWLQGKATIPPETHEKLVDMLLAADLASLIDAARQDAKQVLVVDDDPSSAYSLARILRQLGYSVATAADGASALEQARRIRPEVVFVDLRMPGMDGVQIAEAIKAEGLAGHVIAATSYRSELERDRTASAGFAAHLLKPVERSTLEEILTRLH